MQLSRRLQTIYDLVPDGATVCDVGTDHGWLPIELVSSGKSPRVLAMDLREGPLQRAREHVDEAGLREKIELRLSDGLEELKPGEADAITICGMGGNVMQHILEDTPTEEFETLGIKTFILQPQSELRDFRYYLMTHSFEIIEEEMVFEEGKYYPIIVAVKSDKVWTATELELTYGPILLRENHPILRLYLEYRYIVQKKICQKVRENSKDSERKLVQAEEELHKIEAALDLFY